MLSFWVSCQVAIEDSFLADKKRFARSSDIDSLSSDRQIVRSNSHDLSLQWWLWRRWDLNEDGTMTLAELQTVYALMLDETVAQG